MTVELFSSLPDSLIRSLVTDWLCCRTLVRLDSAFCVKGFSSELQTFYSALDWKGAFDNTVLNSSGQYRSVCEWILNRKLGMSSLTFWGKVGNGCTDLVHRLIIHNLDNIKHVSIWQPDEFKDNVAEYVGIYCNKLESLSCSLATEVSPGLSLILFRNETLKSLYLDRHNSLEMEIILRLAKCPSITSLDLVHDITPSLAELLSTAFPNVATLTLHSVYSDAVQLLYKLPLRKLTLQKIMHAGVLGHDSNDVEGTFAELQQLAVCEWTENTPVSHILAHTPQLTDVELFDFTREGDAPYSAPSAYDNNILHQIGEHVGARLKVLSCINVNGIPDSGLLELAQNCPNIQEIVIQACYHKISQDTVVKLLSKCPELTSYNIQVECCCEILEAVVKYCPLLHTISFDYFEFDVEEKHWIAFVTQAKALKELTLGDDTYPVDVDEFTVEYRKNHALWREMNE